MTISRSLYTAGVSLARGLLRIAPRGDGKLARAARGMRGAPRRLEAWAAAHRDPRRPLLWFHAPSVGEGFQARAVMDAVRAVRPEAQLLYTFFSPSAEPFARGVAADVTDYLPADLPRVMARALEALKPDAVVFSKTEVWPNLTHEASRRGIPVLLLSATLPPTSSRLRPSARVLLREAHASLTMVGAISAADADRYALLGVPSDRRRVTGDARFDQVWRRARAADREGALLRHLSVPGPPRLVAGSTWPADEERLLAALEALRRKEIPIRLLIAPHEPTDAMLGRLEGELDRRGFPHLRLSSVAAEPAPDAAVIVDRMGVLGDLYAAADIAYVGGGFGRAGLHSVLEPAAFGVPILFGPHHRNAREAGELIRVGAAAAPADASALEEALRHWLVDEGARAAAGAAAAGYVEGGRGAAERGARAILDLLPGAGPR